MLNYFRVTLITLFFVFTYSNAIAQQSQVEGGHITWEFKQEPRTRTFVGAYGRPESVTDTVGYIRFHLRFDNQDDTWGYYGGLQFAYSNLRTRLTGEGYNSNQTGSFHEGHIWFFPQTKTYENLMANEADPNFILKKESIYRRPERGSASINSFKGKSEVDPVTNPKGWDKEGVRNVLKGIDGYKIPPKLNTAYYATPWLEVDPRQWDYTNFIEVAVFADNRAADWLPLPPSDEHPYGFHDMERNIERDFTSTFKDELWHHRARNYKGEHQRLDAIAYRARIYPHYDENGNKIPFHKTIDKSAVPYDMGYQGVFQNGQGSFIASAYDEDGDLLVYRWDDPIDLTNYKSGGVWRREDLYNQYYWNNPDTYSSTVNVPTNNPGRIKWRIWDRTYGMQPTLDTDNKIWKNDYPYGYPSSDRYTSPGQSYNDFYQYREKALFNHEIYLL